MTRVALCLLGVLVAAPDAGPPAPIDDVPTYRLDQEVRGGEAAQIAELARWAHRAGARRLEVVIDSQGGDAAEGLALVLALRGAHALGLVVGCTVERQAASTAFLALQGCDVRRARAQAILGMHNPVFTVPHPVSLTVEEVQRAAAVLAAIADASAGIVAGRLGLTVESYRQRVAGGEVWIMTAPQALAAHAIDRVVP